jgi:glycosyltransferase involved in cell wall biosynthesis
MLRISVIAPSTIPARRANTLQVMKMTQAISALGHRVHLIAPSKERMRISESEHPELQPNDGYPRSLSDADWDELAEHYGLQIRFPIDWLPAKPTLRGYDYSLRAVQWARRWEADLFYTRLPQAAFLASILGMATIFEVHDIPQGFIGPWLLRRYISGRGARKMVVITRSLANDLHKIFSAPLETPFTLVAPDGVDPTRYADLPDVRQARLMLDNEARANLAPSLDPDRYIIGYTGHLYPGRGIHLILEMATHLPEFTFLIVGGEPKDVTHYQNEIIARGLENVILTGFIVNAKLPLYQAACNLLIMPYQERVAASSGGDISRYLSPMKAFEYMACGRPILSSDLPVLREVLNPQNAILLPPDDAFAWITSIKSLQADPQQGARLAAQAQQDAIGYTWEARAARLLEGFENA